MTIQCIVCKGLRYLWTCPDDTQLKCWKCLGVGTVDIPDPEE